MNKKRMRKWTILTAWMLFFLLAGCAALYVRAEGRGEPCLERSGGPGDESMGLQAAEMPEALAADLSAYPSADLSGGDASSVSDNSPDADADNGAGAQASANPQAQEQAAMEKGASGENTGGLLRVVLPSSVRLSLDPYRISGAEQIFSEDITVENHSSCAVEVILKKLECRIPQEETKSCELYLYRKDSDAAIRLLQGDQAAADSFVLPVGESAFYYFRGSLKEGSEAFWEEQDIQIRLIFSFRKAETADKGAEQ